MPLLYTYRRPALSEAKKGNLLSLVREKVSGEVSDIETEHCFYIETTDALNPDEISLLRWLLSETFEPENYSDESFLQNPPLPPLAKGGKGGFILEIGPRMNFTTAWSTNAVSVCHACGLTKVTRIERSRRYKIVKNQKSTTPPNPPLTKGGHGGVNSDLISSLVTRHSSLLFDRMTECQYKERLRTFETGMKPEPVYTVRVIEEGKTALEKINRKLGLGFDEWDMDYYHELFVNGMRRNPTDVECFDLGQSNSEHSRHWFFRGQLIIDGIKIPNTLMDIIKKPYKENPNNSVIAFRDNSSAIRGYRIKTIIPENPGKTCRFTERDLTCHLTFTAETHNFPTGVAPFPGAETGTGGRIRDVQAVGRGGLVIAGTAAYCVGNLHIPGYKLPWEDDSFEYPENLASPLQIEIEASNGASDYGNKFGEPLIQGFTRSFGMKLPNGERREWIKPIMFTGGVGQMDARHVEKGEPEKGMLVIKVGGPAYRIGIGGGAASSMIQGENVEELDFNAVQRGDAEMEQKLNRVIRACIEMGNDNPVMSIHDQGAGGNCNVIKELAYPAGAKIDIRNIPVGDNTLSVLEIWGAEYQESNALLIKPEKRSVFEGICKREKVPCAIAGTITGDGHIVLFDGKDGSAPVNLDLKKVLGEMPQKKFRFERIAPELAPLKLPEGLTVKDALERVLRLVSVGSKRFLTNKVDRSVTGLIAQQQCAGPLHLTVSDVAVIAQSHFGLTGAAIAIGEQPIKGLINPAAMARMAVAEALTNIVWAKVSSLEDIRCSGNWMWPAKLPGEGAALYDAAMAMMELMLELGIAVDGGKDSISMAAVVKSSQQSAVSSQAKEGTVPDLRTKRSGVVESGLSPNTEIVKAPGSLVISAYATCPDITKIITPDIKRAGKSKLIYIDLGKGKKRLGGSSLAQAYNQIGEESPDIEDSGLLKRAFIAIQMLIDKDLILSGHDISDGGLIVALLEMAFSGNCGVEIDIRAADQQTSRPIDLDSEATALLRYCATALPLLFSEEAGLVIEYSPDKEKEILELLAGSLVDHHIIGSTTAEKRIKANLVTRHSSLVTVLDEDMQHLRAIWEETGYQLERLQVNPAYADEEKRNIYERKGPPFTLTFTPEETSFAIFNRDIKPKVGIIREEGSNGDREMTSAFYQSGFDVYDVTMTDLLDGEASLKDFKGIAFVGGFSYADVLDSAKGWAGVIRFNKKIYEQFQSFYNRKDTFSLGVCNGCQLMALLGWVPWQGIEDRLQPRFIHNKSGRFESRFTTVRILESPAIMLNGMKGSVLGVWVAHGEGQAYFPDKGIKDRALDMGLAPVRYVDDKGDITESYPFNPNGSPDGIAALCSPDGRHLSIMPHPERTFLKWQWPWMPEEWKRELKASPWLRMFQNARGWCDSFVSKP